MNTIFSGFTGLLLTLLTYGLAAAWSHANRWGRGQGPSHAGRPHGGRARLRSAALCWRFGVAASLLLVTAAAAWAADDSATVPIVDRLHAGAPPYQLGVGKLDGTLGLREFPGRHPTPRRVAQAAGAPAAAGVTAAEPDEQELSASEMSQKLTNPVGNLWALQSQFNNFRLANGQWNNNWNFQPTLPVRLTKDWNLITRPVLPLYDIVPVETAPGQYERKAGLGDMILAEMLSPAQWDKWLLGVGPTFIFPTATSTYTGQGKWQAGPAVTLGYRTPDFILGAFAQQWWSIGGDSDRPDTSQMNLQPIAAIFFGDGWDIGYSGNILANWKASSGDVWTVPIGLNVGKVVKLGRLPVKLQVAVQYMPVHPQNTGQEWNIQVQITPVIPKLIKGILFQ